MRVTNADIWDYLPTHRVVVTTNVGWTVRGGRNPMGRGIALQAAKRFPELPALYGQACKVGREKLGVIEYDIGPIAGEERLRRIHHAADLGADRALILFPTKPFNPAAPHLSWKSKASLELIERGARQLAAGWASVPVALPLVGCANGGLRDVDVLPILERYLKADNFLLVLR